MMEIGAIIPQTSYHDESGINGYIGLQLYAHHRTRTLPIRGYMLMKRLIVRLKKSLDSDKRTAWAKDTINPNTILIEVFTKGVVAQSYQLKVESIVIIRNQEPYKL
ncbi:uncharacterized protein FOBCDRAFT_138779 [Fusarium oxysporum Fo47]|uniref:uncharacterized protein n=1 Tax=Fusarium oxysporum Fo47 TaxID=660027 RepID=UPI002869CAD2|nr:uncharacterized protein FOBCDRAFT_138779 [Fusarium oxysporum Fo47]QKD56902.2 hypothetical protein FOBCDRAFT_138779 [Fusarium oxysporum Fo47]